MPEAGSEQEQVGADQPQRGVGAEGGQEAQRGGRGGRTGDQEGLRGPAPGGEPAGDDADEAQPQGHRHEEQRRTAGGQPAEHLQVDHQVDQGAHHRRADQALDREAEPQGRDPEHRQGQDRLGRRGLPPEEEPEQGHRRADQGQHDGGGPGVPVAAPLGGQQQHHREGRGHRGAGEVDATALGLPGQPEYDGGRDQDQQAERQVEIENPPPAGVVDDEPAQQRADGHAEAADEPAEVAPLLSAVDQVRHHDHGHAHQAAGSDPLDGPEGDELGHALRDAAERGPGQEGGHRAEVDRLRAEDVAEFAVERQGGGGRQCERADQPGQPGHAVHGIELPHDRHGGGGDDVRVQQRQDDRQQAHRHAEPPLVLRHRGSLGRRSHVSS
nr:hypothetical protein [Micromonospora arborensis]